MNAEICLQGGAEFQPGCEAMDAAMLGLPGTPRRVLIAAFACRPGRERQIATANAERWYRGLGAKDVAGVLDEADFAEALGGAELLVLPGGSPARLLESLQPHAVALRAAVDGGTAISGASAGAMVLCGWTVLPGGRAVVAAGLGIVPVDLVLPHYREGAGWVDLARQALPADAVVLGLPERSGVIVGKDGALRPAGVEGFTRLPMG